MKINHKLLVVFFIAILSLLQACSSSFDVEERNLEIKNILDNYRGNTADLRAAYKLLRPLLEKYPKNAMGFVNLCRLITKAGYIQGDEYDPGALEKAEKALDQAVALDPELFDAYYHGVFHYIRRNNLEKARQFTLKAQELRPGSAKTDLLFCELALEEDNPEEVIRRANSAIANSNDTSVLHDAYFALSKTYKKRKEYEKVVNIYRKTIEIFPDDPWNMDAYAAFLLYHMEDYDKAIEYARRALEIMDFGMARKHLGQAYYKKAATQLWEDKQYEAAAENFLSAAQYHPTANAYYGLGISYWYWGHHTRQVELLREAAKALNQALEMDPSHEQARKQLDDLQGQLTKFDT
ncbi:tetratricopeptide repeat protein [Desulfosudis oleivorans]|uniref:Tetratricopeptide TPR_2 repeat protein n=1 Tax=Desulfosudis oleivorans (strain DSM 6200 / JCM 39069 / Hxd3) TaxID=96561 RepID=A8ZWF6_DESOH|nr:tetratricopeptide repeat protein [Desulfosudis oleivorans]ABW66764.1 Tetratricopeptide TPR_2 repeat protein [Desulfosudis oleivorans Hxd3]